MEKSKQVALVTGASSGVGRATAQLFAASGFRVFGTSRTQHPDADNVEMLGLDVTSDDSVYRCIEEVLTRAGQIEVLVNNTGVWQVSIAEETPLPIAHAIFETNVFGVVRMTDAVRCRKRRALAAIFEDTTSAQPVRLSPASWVRLVESEPQLAYSALRSSRGCERFLLHRPSDLLAIYIPQPYRFRARRQSHTTPPK